MCSDVAIQATGLSKHYYLYNNPQDRLMQMLWRGRKKFYRKFEALKDTSFKIKKGESFGIIGRNGAGKSTLLQLIAGTLTPSSGQVEVNGRIAALLELGSGFNPEFTGRENVYMNAAILGLSREEIDARYEDIAAFADIGTFIDQPVKTYSSGMQVRLAFSVAVNVDPDILIIDEALSVGDGVFSRKSFDRIMEFRKAGKTILFCSHSIYQVEALCNRALWLDHGKMQMIGQPAAVVTAYGSFLDAESSVPKAHQASPEAKRETPDINSKPYKHARITGIKALVDGVEGKTLQVKSTRSEIMIQVSYDSDPQLQAPTLALAFTNQNGRKISSVLSKNDGLMLHRGADGKGEVAVTFPKFALLKGSYWLDVYLLCESGINLYDKAKNVVEFHVVQKGLEQGVVSLPHVWHDGS